MRTSTRIPPSIRRLHTQYCRAVIQVREPFARVGQSNPATLRITRRAVRRAPRAVGGSVRDGNVQLAIAPVRLNAHRATALARRNTVLHGILHQRLNEKVRDELALHVGVDEPLHCESLPEANLLDVEILPDERDLAAERHELFAAGVHYGSQQIAEPQDHRAGLLRLVAQEHRDAVERVEEEVWLELCPQPIKRRIAQLGSQFCRGALFARIQASVRDPVQQRSDDPVLPVRRRHEGDEAAAGDNWSGADHLADGDHDAEVQRYLDRCDHRGGDEVARERPPPIVDEGEASREPRQQRGECGECDPVDAFFVHVTPPLDRSSRAQITNDVLCDERRGGEGPRDGAKNERRRLRYW